MKLLLHESIDGLNINPDGIYVDVTFGGGGHSIEILKRLTNGHLYAFDQDPDAEKNAPDDERFTFIPENFRYMKNFLMLHGVRKVNGILADLGVSSHQFDDPERGFSTRFDGELDMRMNQDGDLSAKKIVNEYSEEELSRILYEYGDLKKSRVIANRIVYTRTNAAINTSQELKDAVKTLSPRNKENKFFAQIFQALRIEVNRELDALKEFLSQSKEILAPQGRLSVISYHSLEDRLVKNWMRKGKFSGEVEKDFFGNQLTPYKIITRKPIVPNSEEIENNTRARSAKLRVAEIINEEHN